MNNRTYTLVYDDVFKDKRLKAIDALILSKLLSLQAINNNDYITVSNKWIAERFSISEKTVTRSINLLEQLHYISTRTTKKATDGKITTVRKIKMLNTNDVKRKYTNDKYKEIINTINLLFNTKYERFNDQQLDVIDSYEFENIKNAVFIARGVEWYQKADDKRVMFRSKKAVNDLLEKGL